MYFSICMEEIHMGTLFLTTVHYSISPDQDIFTKHLLFLVLVTVKWVKQIVDSDWRFKATIPLLKATIIPGRGWQGRGGAEKTSSLFSASQMPVGAKRWGMGLFSLPSSLIIFVNPAPYCMMRMLDIFYTKAASILIFQPDCCSEFSPI